MVWKEQEVTWDLVPSPATGGILKHLFPRVLVPIKRGDTLKTSQLSRGLIHATLLLPFSRFECEFK